MALLKGSHTPRRPWCSCCNDTTAVATALSDPQLVSKPLCLTVGNVVQKVNLCSAVLLIMYQNQETCIIQCNSFLGMLVTSWDLYDSFNVSEIKPTSKAEGSRATTGKSSKSHTTKEHNQTMLVSSNRGNIFPDLHFCHVFILLNHVYHYAVWWKLHEENAWSACLHLKESLLKNLGQVCTETFSVQCRHKSS